MTVASVRLDEFLDRGNQITETVAATSRICAQFLPKYELPPNAKSVISTVLTKGTLEVDDVSTIPLAEIRVTFLLDWQQLSASDLATPLYIVQKHAQAYCRLEDRLLLVGQAEVAPTLTTTGVPDTPGVSSSKQLPFVRTGFARLDPVGEVERGSPNRGLRRADLQVTNDPDIYKEIARFHSTLQDSATSGPWALVMGTTLFDRSDRTSTGFVDSPRQRLENLLGTKIYRTNILPKLSAILLGGATTAQDMARLGEPMGPVDRAVALEPQLRHYGIDSDGRYKFAIFGSLALRVRDKSGILQIRFEDPEIPEDVSD